MGLTVKSKAGGVSTFKHVPAGLHLARCYRVIDLGTQPSTWMGTIKHQPKVMVQFEVHSEDADGSPLVTEKGEPLSISKNFTASLNENARLRQELENWRSRAFTEEELAGFELKTILGVWAMLSVVREVGSDGNEYTNINSINPVTPQIKKAGLPQGHNELKIFDLEKPDMEMFESLGVKTKEKIQNSPEWKNLHAPTIKPVTGKPTTGLEDLEDDDIPF